MNIAFIGYGSMAQALATKWRDKHVLFFSGRDHVKAAEVAARFGGQSGTAAEAVGFADVVVLATPASAVFEAIELAGGAGAFAGKTVVDINNPVDIETFATNRKDGSSLTTAIADALPGAHVGKAFNMSQAKVWESPEMTYDGRVLVTFFTADAEPAVDTIRVLIEDVGSEPLHVGSNALAYQLEAAAALIIKLLYSGRNPHTVLNVIQPEVKSPH